MSGSTILTSGVVLYWEQYQFGERGVVRVSLSVERPSKTDRRETEAFVRTLLPKSAGQKMVRGTGTTDEIDKAIAEYMSHGGTRTLMVN